MADSAVHALTQKTSLAATDEMYLVQSPYGAGDDRRAVLSDLNAYISATASALTNKTRVAVTGGTVTSSTPVFDATQTWNNVATTFTGIKFNVASDTSASGSLLMDLQVGGTSQGKLDKSGNATFVGQVVAKAGIQSSPSYAFSGLTNTGMYAWSNSPAFTVGGAITYYFSSTHLNTTAALAFGSATATGDTILIRDAANTLALRNGTSAQTLNWYFSYTDASNYTRGALKTSSGVVEVAAESAGTGTANIDVKLTTKGTGVVQYGTHNAIAGETVTGYITIKDAGGTTRKLAVVS